MDQDTLPAVAGATTIAGQAHAVATQPGARGAKPRAFSFGDAEPVLRRDFLGMLECRHNGRWYSPPVPMEALARAYRMSPHHQSALIYKRNQLLKHFVPSRWLDRRNFGEFALNFMSMGNGYLERRDNLAGRPMSLVNSPAINTRRGVQDGQFWWVPGFKRETEFAPDRVFHLWEPDLTQEIYGLPEYLSALQSGLLNEAATIFRRRYYLNGSHAGYILYVNDDKFDEDDAEGLEEVLDKSRGDGNFKNVLLHLPGGGEKGVQLIPIGEAGAKDEFLGVKNTTRDDVLAAHRVPPVLLGVVPQNTGGFGDIAKAADVFFAAEIEPLMARMLEVNDWLGVEAVAFKPYEKHASAGAGENRAAGRS